DLLIGGSASNLNQRTSPAQLRAVLVDWILSRGTGGLGSVTEDGQADDLRGGLGEDWFHSLAEDLAPDYRPLTEADKPL
ncbi:MAG: hypothetical protein J5I93_01675, partial [Pirellulaceae bacterium]|nr:hypothetical protein [Pirellulaceae bacterium]